MCGIAGIIDAPDGHDRAAVIRAMAHSLAHRGPDHTGFFEDGSAALAHLRLSILDTSPRGHQPMRSPDDRYILLHNGEIYNFREVRSMLPGPFETETDSEMIIAAFRQWGPDCVRRFNGMYAFVLWDTVAQSLFIARDRLGIKPLYFHQDGATLAFASEVRALLQLPWYTGRIDRDALASYLCYQTVYGDRSLLQNIEMLPPGHYATFKHGKLDVTQYWDMYTCASEEPATLDSAALRRRIRELLGAAVERRMISDVPLGAFLSGGIDSSAIVALMSTVSAQPVDTFSVVFSEKAYDESRWSEMIARKYNTRHHPIHLKPQDFLEALPAALQAMDHPSGDGINSYVVSQVTKAAGMTVALSGLGGDELFGGYPVFTQLPQLQERGMLWALPAALRRSLSGFAAALKGGRQGAKLRQLMRARDNSWLEIYKVFRTIYDWAEIPALTGRKSGIHPLDALLGGKLDSMRDWPALSRISAAEINSYTQNVLLRDTDQMSMRHALEVRVPFFDHELVAFALGISDTEKRPTTPKRLLVEALGDLLPDEVVNRQKMGFVFPWEQWLRNDLQSYCDLRIRRMQDRGLLDADLLGKVWREFRAGSGPWLWTHVWLPVVLDEWMENNSIEA